MSELISNLLTRLEGMESVRQSYMPSWEDISVYVAQSNVSVYGDNPKGDNSNNDSSYDSTACYAAQRLASVINSVLTNQSSEWFRVETDNEATNAIPIVKRWCEELTNITIKELENSNLYTELLTLYNDLTTYGTGCMYIEEDSSPERELRFSTRHIREIYIDEDKYGYVDTVFRKCKMTARQMVQRWEGDVHQSVRDALERDPGTEYEILHAVMPREERDITKKNPQNYKYASYWIDIDNRHLMSEGGYTEFCYVVPRWSKESGEVYGRSPSYVAIADVKTLNAMMKTLLEIAQKIATPPVLLVGEIVSTAPNQNSLDLRPGGVNVSSGAEAAQVAPINQGLNAPITIDMIQMKIDRILEIFYNNQLQVVDKRNMTAAEVEARTQENWRVLGSIFNRLTSELLERMLTRIISLLMNSVDVNGNAFFPAAPKEASNANLRIRYLSPLARSQKVDDLMGIQNVLAQTLQLAQANPSVLDNINFDQVIRKYGELSGVPQEIFMDEEQMNQIRQQKQMMAQQQQQLAMEQQQAETLKAGAQGAKAIQETRNASQSA